MIQWEKMKTEYITSQCSYQDLCKKYAVSYGTLKIHARCDHWVEERRKYRKKTMEKSLNLIAEQQARDLARVQDLADNLLSKLEIATEELQLLVIHHKESGAGENSKWEKSYEETVPGGMVDRQGLKTLTACLKDLKQVKAVMTELEQKEQELKLMQLEQETHGEQSIPALVIEGDDSYAQ